MSMTDKGSDITSMDVDRTMADEDELASSSSGTSGDNSQQSLTDQMKGTAQQAMTQTQQMAGQALGKAKDTVKSQIGAQKDRAVSSLGGFTDALHQTGQQLRQSGQGVFGDYADNLAEQVDRAVGYLREHDVDDLSREVENFARNQPALFIGGAFVIGVALARFIKSSASDQESSMPQSSGPQFATAANASGSMNNMNLTNSWNSDSTTGATNMSDSTSNNRNTGAGRTGSVQIPEQVYENADPSRHLDEFDDDALPDNDPMTAHGYVAGVGEVGDMTDASGDNNIANLGDSNGPDFGR